MLGINRRYANIIFSIILLIGFSAFTTSMDSYAYETFFNEVKESNGLPLTTAERFGFDIGFILITKIISIFIKDYILYRACIFVISLIIVWLSTVKLLKIDYFPVLLYFLFPFVFDAFQICFLLSYSIVYLGLCYLITEKSHFRSIYFMMVIVATLIHSSAILFVIFLLYKSNRKIVFRLFLLSFVLFTVLNLVFRFNTVRFLSAFFPNFSALDKYSSYQLNIMTIIMVIIHCLVIIVYSYYLRIDDNKHNNLFFINTMMVMLFPLIFSDLNFERYYRPVILLNYCFITNDLFGFRNEDSSFVDTPVDSKLIFEVITLLFSIIRFMLHFTYVKDIYNSVLQ